MDLSVARFALKVLRTVEVDPARSHQHELHAGLLRTILGFEEKTSGTLTFVFYSDGEPVIVETQYTVYDSRVRSRRSEWRLYYYGHEIADFARDGDLLLIARLSADSTDLYAVIARAGTPAEAGIRAAFAVRDTQKLERFVRVEAVAASDKVANAFAPGLLQPDIHLQQHPLFRRALETGRMPNTEEMAAAARALVQQQNPGGLNPDEFLLACLNVETQLFEAIEAGLGKVQLKDLLDSGAEFDAVMKFALSKLQSRKARRGASLEHHVRSLLSTYGVPFSAQCETERGQRPDFVVPGCAEYHDESFPSERLRMIGCKSKIRDRWRQYLAEAARIAVKHHISLDEGLSDEVIRQMAAQKLRICLPREVIEKAYSGRAIEPEIMTIEELINELKSVTVGVQLA